jgi:6-phosphogluconolactonase (cycloisomerase 2 family)
MIFSCHSFSGPLSQKQVFIDNSNGNNTLGFIKDSASTSDNKFVYNISSTDKAINIFSLGNDGLLSLVNTIVADETTTEGVRDPGAILMSPDDSNLYVLGMIPGSVTMVIKVYDVDPQTGALTFVQNYTGRGLYNSGSMIFSEDGAYIYIVSITGNSLTALRRSSNGFLNEIQFDNDIAKDLGFLEYPISVAISPDRQHLYVGTSGSDGDAIVHYSRDIASGMVTYENQVDYTTAGLENLERPNAIAISSDFRHLYADSDEVIYEFSVADDGSLSFIGSADVEAGATISQMSAIKDIEISSNGRLLYASDTVLDAVLMFHRNEESGELSYVGTEIHGVDGVTELRQLNKLHLSSDSRRLYTGGAYGFTVFDTTADLSVSVEMDGVAGNAYEIAATVTNNGEADAVGTVYSASFPDDILVNDVEAPVYLPQCEFDEDERVVTCEVGVLPPGDAATFILSVEKSAGGSAFDIQHEVTADTVDDLEANNMVVASPSDTGGNQDGGSGNPTNGDEEDDEDDSDGGSGSLDFLLLAILAAAMYFSRSRRFAA